MNRVQPHVRSLLLLSAAILGAAAAIAEEPAPALAETLVTADSIPPLRTQILSREMIRDAPQRSLDGILRQVPGFSLFRRSDSLIAHPTSQGVSLGNTGPNGASRSVVLLDGVPMNDPFGGWIPWSRFPAAQLSRVSVTPNGRADFPGPGMLCGTIALDSRALNNSPFATVEVAGGDRLEHDLSVGFVQEVDQGKIRLFGAAHSLDFSGYRVIRSDQRGPVDTRATSRSQSFDAGVRLRLSPDDHWGLTLRTLGWKEQRGNGTLLALNQSDALDFSIRLENRGAPSDWSGSWALFHQRRNFSSTFTSVAPDRTRETLALDQFSVPSVSSGFLQGIRIPLGETHTLALGSDLRFTEGFTHEYFRNLGAGFTREREAGGHQTDAGVSIADTWSLSPKFTLTPSIRAELHRESGGRLREWDLRTGRLLTAHDYSTRQSVPIDLGLAARWTPLAKWETEASVFSSHRNPTLNELYRPFRVGNTVTLANPQLRRETLVGAEAAFAWHADPRLTLRARAFLNELRDAVANVSQVRGPGVFPGWGPLPPDGVGARRENLDAVRIQGVELGADVNLPGSLHLEMRWLHAHSRIHKARIQPGLDGLALAQFPENQIRINLHGENVGCRWNLGARYTTSQFDDDLNQRRLASAFSIDAQVTRRLGKRCEVFVAVENLFNAEIQARRDPDGTIGITGPRACTLGVRSTF
jgi:vitamin B12 transporter